MNTCIQRYSDAILLLFTISLGLTGSLSADINKVVYVLGVLALLPCLYRALKGRMSEHCYERRYLRLLMLFVAYGILLIVVWTFLPNRYDLKPTYGGIEELVFNYALLPLFCYAVGLNVSQKGFERAMVAFGCCTALNGFFLLFAYFDLATLVDTPSTFFSEVLRCRFTGCESRISWVDVFVKDYSFFPALGVLCIIPFAMRLSGWQRWLAAMVALLNVFFLLLTINRGTMVGFFTALLLIFFYSLRHLQWKSKMGYGLLFLVLCYSVVVFMPQSIKVRFADMCSESYLFFKEGHYTGSVSSRLTIWKTLMNHVGSFWLFGDGPIYATNKLRIYLTEAGFDGYVQSGFIYHSQYLAYFHHYGIVGLLFLPAALLYPIYATICRLQFSITLASILILFLFALLEDRYLGKAKVTPLLFFVYFSFFQVSKWRHREQQPANSNPK
jgi:hypothetical protein